MPAEQLDEAYVAGLHAAVEAHLVTAHAELNGRLSEGITRLTNARAALQGELGAAASQKFAQLRGQRGRWRASLTGSCMRAQKYSCMSTPMTRR